jgi:hypothetical protein
VKGAARCRLAGVDAHSGPDAGPLRPGVRVHGELSVRCGVDRAARARKRVEQAVAGLVELRATVASERLGDQVVVVVEDRPVRITQRAEQARRTLEIAEDERHRRRRARVLCRLLIGHCAEIIRRHRRIDR